MGSSGTEMPEVRRNSVCPECGLGFLIIFDSADPLSDVATQVSCPRGADGRSLSGSDGGPPCGGYVLTHVPEAYALATVEAAPRRAGK